MKITKIFFEDFLCLDYFKADQLGKLNKITGGNGKGKSAILTGIKETFKSSGHEPRFVRMGTDKAQLVVELDSNIKIDRRITQSGTSLKVTIGDQPVDKPQTFLNKIFGPFNFNPIDFFAADNKRRRAMLLAALPISVSMKKLMALLEKIPEGIDLSNIDYSQHGLEVIQAAQKLVYDYRHEVNIGRTQLEKSIKQDKADMPENIDKDEYAALDIGKISTELSEVKSAIDSYKKDEADLEDLRRRNVQLKSDIETLEMQLKQKREELAEVKSRGEQVKAKLASHKNISELESKRSKLQEAITNYKKSEELRLRLKDIARKETELESIAEHHRELDEFYKVLMERVPAELLKKCKLPVESLEIEGDNIIVDGKQIDKLSTSEQLRLSIEIARALAGELKVICIDRFESLDEEARTVFEKECSGDDFEYFITQVTGGDLKIEQAGELTESRESGKGKKKPDLKAADF